MTNSAPRGENRDMSEAEEKFDPADPWDVYVASFGKNFKFDKDYYPDGVPNITDEQCFQLGIEYMGGSEYNDGFGAFDPGAGEWVLVAPDKLTEFDENLMNGKYRVQFDAAVAGQPDGVGSSGHVWTVRLWDRKKDEEIPGSRFFANKLSHGATAALQKMPEWGRVEWQPNAKEKDFLEARESKRRIDEVSHAIDHHLTEADSKGWKNKIQEYLSQSPLFKEIVDAGGAGKWVEQNIDEKTGTKKLGKFVKGLEYFNDLIFHFNLYYEDPEKFRKEYSGHEVLQIIDGDSGEEEGDEDEEDGENNHGGDGEGDGWLSMPKWK